MIPFLLAAGSALLWGTSDFAGGKASQRSTSITVSVMSAVIGLPVLAIGVLIVGGSHPSTTDLAWSAGAGVAGFTGLVLFYRALAGGNMAIAAPVTGVASAVVPLIAGLCTQRLPDRMSLTGATLAIVAVALVSVAPGGRGGPAGRVVTMAITSGLFFGLFFVLLAQTNPATGMWPLLGARLGSISLGTVVLLATRTVPRLAVGSRRWTVFCGVADIAATLLYLAASQRGLLSIVAPVASLYPAATVVLALVIDRERVRPIQVAGLSLAIAAMVLAAV